MDQRQRESKQHASNLSQPESHTEQQQQQLESSGHLLQLGLIRGHIQQQQCQSASHGPQLAHSQKTPPPSSSQSE